MIAVRIVLTGLALAFLSCRDRAPEAAAPPASPDPAVTSEVAESCAPERMVRVVLRDDSEEVPPSVTIHRLGTRFGRVDVRGADGSARSTIVDEPDTWIVDHATGRVTHHADEGPPPVLRLRLFGGTRYPEWLQGLEVGCEIAFFDRYGAPGEVETTLAGTVRSRVIEREGFEVRLESDPATDVPQQVLLHDGGELVGFVEYLEYDANLEPRPELFRP